MILKNVISPCLLNSLLADVGDSSYSLIIDESTDSANLKVLCLMLKYYSARRSTIVTTFYRLILIEDCSAQGLYDAVTNQLAADGLPLNNLAGIGVDGANVMVGKHHSFFTLLQQVIPDLIVVKCVCHSLHLCAEYACKQLPKQLEFLVREVHNYFSHSPKRLNEYRNLYIKLGNLSTPKKVAKLSGTRWLARESAISTILQQWDELFLFFTKAKVEDKCFSAEQIIHIMERPAFKVYLVFLKYNLEKICQVNTMFQSENVNQFLLFQDLLLLFKSILKVIVVPAQLQKISQHNLISFEFDKYLMHDDAIYFGYSFDVVSQDLNPDDKKDVRKRCKQFLVEFCKQVQARLPENINILEKINILKPETATSQKKLGITDIVNTFSRYSPDNCQREWEMLSNKQWTELDDPIKFWAEVKNDKDSAGNARFQNIANFALSLLASPVSNATVERAFSIYNTVKNKIRNRLSLEMTQAVLMTRYYLKIDAINCVNFKPTEEMLKKFNVRMYDFKDIDHSVDDQTIEIMNQLISNE
jgi:hypothetical protein